jgi:hypothetical protein
LSRSTRTRTGRSTPPSSSTWVSLKKCDSVGRTPGPCFREHSTGRMLRAMPPLRSTRGAPRPRHKRARPHARTRPTHKSVIHKLSKASPHVPVVTTETSTLSHTFIDCVPAPMRRCCARRACPW